MTKLKNRTGVLYYGNKTQDLWIQKISQENTLEGKSFQSKFTRHFYPSTYSPGNLYIECIAKSQENYQEIAKFVRDHQILLANNNSSLAQSKSSPLAMQTDFMYLSIESEQIFMQGFVDNIKLSKVGVFDPAPVFNISFVMTIDINRNQDYGMSNQIKQNYYNNVGDSLDIQTEANRNYPGGIK